MTDQHLSTLRRRVSEWNEGNGETPAEVFFESSFQRWVVTSYAAVLAIFQAHNPGPPANGARRCPVAGTPDIGAVLARGEYLFSLGLKFQRSPDTERLRKTMMRHLGANEMHAMAASLEESADLLVSSALEHGSLEVIADLATPLVNGSFFSMLGVPVEQWARLANLSKAVSLLFGLGVAESERTAGHFAFAEICRIVQGLMSDVSRPKTPVMADWLEAVRLGTWSRDEALAQIATLINAGRITTITAIGSMVHHLALCPAAWDAAQSGTLPIDAVIEECLRLGPPKTIVSRTLWQGGVVGGVEIPPGERLLLMVGRANRDPAVFDNPLEFDPWRYPKRNLAFGAGQRRCPGMHLAREQMRAALLALLKYFPKLEVVTAPTWTEALHNERVIDSLQIRV
jgi:cytochrome P450